MENDRKIKVLHLRSSGGFYGAESVMLNLCVALNKDGVEAHILGINNAKNPQADLVHRATESGVLASSISCRGFIDFKTVKEIRSYILKNNISIIHCHDYKSDIFGLLGSRGLNVGKISTNHNWLKTDWKLGCYEALDGFIYNFFDKVIAVSDSIARESKRFLLNKAKVRVISNGIDTGLYGNACLKRSKRLKNELGLQDNDFVIGTVGRLSVEKDQTTLLRALKGLKEAGAEDECLFRLLLIGGGEQEADLRNVAREFGLEPYVKFLGVRTDLPELYSIMDVFVLSSLREGLPMVILEAMAAKVPIIATPAGGVVSVIKGQETGWVVDFADHAGIARIIQGMKNKEIVTDDIVAKAKELVEKEYSSEAMAQKYARVYEEVCEVAEGGSRE